MPPRTSFLERHGRRMACGRWIAIPLFLALIVGAFTLAGRIGDVTTSEMTMPGSEGARGIALIETHFSDGHETTDVQPDMVGQGGHMTFAARTRTARAWWACAGASRPTTAPCTSSARRAAARPSRR